MSSLDHHQERAEHVEVQAKAELRMGIVSMGKPYSREHLQRAQVYATLALSHRSAMIALA